MEKKKLIPIILIIISIILFIISIVLLLNTNYLINSNKNTDKDSSVLEDNNVNTNVDDEKTDNNKTENNSSNSNDSNNKNENTNNETDNKTENKNDVSVKPEVKPNNKDESVKQEIIPDKEDDKYTEKDVISYFSNREKQIENNQEDKSLREKAKESFISIIDFIFYDKEIKGYTFDELTTSAKLKIIKIALSIDNKINEYFPDYKNTIKDKYVDMKGKLAVKYLEFTKNLCDNVGSDTCSQAKEDFNTMKESFGFTWDLIKELAKSGSNKVKEFYESWRDSE